MWGYIGSQYVAELGSFGEMSDGEAGSSVRTSKQYRGGKHEGSPLENILGPAFRSDWNSSDGMSGVEEFVGTEVRAPGGVSNGKFTGNIGEIHWEE